MRPVLRLILLTGMFVTACSPATPTPQPLTPEGYYPLDTMTGIEDVDNVLAAVASGDPQRLREQVRFTVAPCTTADGLGGPPKCREGEEEGTRLEVLPMISSEGHFIRKDEIDTWQGIDATGLYAVYRVSENALDEEYYPPGDYLAIFVPEDNEPGIGLRIADGGIVRVDTLFDVFPGSVQAIIERDTSEVILPPNPR